MSRRPRIMIADDHSIVVDGLRQILGNDYEIIGSVSDGLELARSVPEVKPDLVVADISMPNLNGIDALRRLRKQGHQVKVLFLTMHPELSYATEAIAAGANGYILKNAVTSELLQAVETVLGGGRYLPPSLAPRIEAALADFHAGRRRSLSTRLTDRQREVLQLIAEGRSSKEISDLLHVSVRTADFHKQNIKKQLGVHTVAELVREAVKLGLVDSNGK